MPIEFERAFTVVGDTLVLDVRTASGRIEVTAGEPGSVRVTGVRNYTVQVDPPIELMGDVLRIGHRSSRVSYQVVVPTNTRIQARTGSGALLIERVAGSVAATTGSGDVEITAVGGNVDIRTGSGSIRVENFEAALRARTGRGEIRVEGTPGGVWNLATGSGDIRIDVPALSGRVKSGH